MSQDYHSMWSQLGLDLPKHDQLLGFLGKTYQDLFLPQPNRPKSMEYLDFVMSEVHGLRIQELLNAKKAGGIVVGSFCTYVPEELILAAGGVSVGLCAGAEFGFDKAEQYLPANTCPLIKSFFGFSLERVCPYIAACDVVVGENTCDGRKKAYEIFRDLNPNLYVLDLPQTRSPQARALLKAEYLRFLRDLETRSGRAIDHKALSEAINRA